MKLSKETVTLLKNFASINNNILLKPGTSIGTINGIKSVVATADITEIIPSEFGIYDLNEFLAVLSVFTDPDIEFEDKYVSIKQGKNTIKFYGAAEDVLTVPKKEIQFPSADVEFELTEAQLDMIRKTASVLKAEDVSFVGNGKAISIVVGDKKNNTANVYEVELAPTKKKFKINLKVELLKVLGNDYDVSISSRKISRFTSKGPSKLVYFIATEADSTFE